MGLHFWQSSCTYSREAQFQFRVISIWISNFRQPLVLWILMFRQELVFYFHLFRNASFSFCSISLFEKLRKKKSNQFQGFDESLCGLPWFLCLLYFHLHCLSSFQRERGGGALPWDMYAHWCSYTLLAKELLAAKIYALGGYSLLHTKLSKVKWCFYNISCVLIEYHVLLIEGFINVKSKGCKIRLSQKQKKSNQN